MLAQIDDHPPEVRAGRRLEQPFSPGHGQDVPHHASTVAGLTRKRGDLLVGDIVRNRPSLASGDDRIFGPVSALRN